MAERGHFSITPEDIESAKRATGIRPQYETVEAIEPHPEIDFDDLVERFFDEQPELSIYLLIKMEQLASQRIAKNLLDAANTLNLETPAKGDNAPFIPPENPSLKEDPFIAGAVFTYFSIPENIRSRRLTSIQVLPLERGAQEADSAGVPRGEVLGETIYQNLTISAEFTTAIEHLAQEYPEPIDSLEFFAGSAVVISPFVSREKSEELMRLWGFDAAS